MGISIRPSRWLEEFLRRDPSTNILFVGTVRGVESRVLAHEGFELALITAKPVMGKGLLDVVQGVLSVPIGIRQSLAILKRRRADLVIGVGGYTSPTMLVAAALKGIARVILEPNAYPGLANKVVAPFTQRIFLAFESAGTFFDRRKVRIVGHRSDKSSWGNQPTTRQPSKKAGTC